MPNWSDENGRYWWERPGHWAIEIPHPPLITEKGCKCPFCKHSHKNKQEKQILEKQIKPRYNNPGNRT
jgi:hypothetical protein